jgi:hypothetical protein
MRTTTLGVSSFFLRSKLVVGGFFLPVIGVVRMRLSQYRCHSAGSSQTTFLNYPQVIYLPYNYRRSHRNTIVYDWVSHFRQVYGPASIFTLPNLYARVALYIVPVVMLYNTEATGISLSVLL